MKFIPIIILSFFLQGCAFLDFFKKHEEPSIPDNQVVNIDSVALEFCDRLPKEVTLNTFDEVSTEYGNLASLYGKCAVKQANGVKLIKKMGNIK